MTLRTAARTFLSAVALATPLLALAGCPSGGSESPQEKLIVYCGRSEGLLKPVFERFERETGVQVDVAYGQSTPAMANQLALEVRSGGATPCDLFLAQDSGHLGALGEAEILTPLPAELLELAEERFRDPAGRWVGTSGRLRVLVFDPQRTPRERLPKSLAELPTCGLRLAWAPSNGSFRAHVSAMLVHWGEDKTRAWLEAMKAAEPVRFTANSPQVSAVAAGDIDVGFVNHYYLHKLKKQDPELAAENASFASAGEVDNLLMIAGLGITAPEGPRRELALRLAKFLLSQPAQEHFAHEIGEYPTISGVKVEAGVTPLAEIPLAPVKATDLIEVGRVAALLDELDVR